MVRIGSKLEPDVKDNTSKVLTQHLDSFASKATEIVGVVPSDHVTQSEHQSKNEASNLEKEEIRI